MTALGLSRRMIAYYASGEKPIPKTVLLATEGWRMREGAGRKRVRGVAEEGAKFAAKRGKPAAAKRKPSKRRVH